MRSRVRDLRAALPDGQAAADRRFAIKARKLVERRTINGNRSSFAGGGSPDLGRGIVEKRNAGDHIRHP
jgi:hypothetical protein